MISSSITGGKNRGYLIKLLAVALALVGFVLRAATQDLYVFKIDKGTVRVAKYLGDADVVRIPETIDGMPVTSIGGGAFSECSSLASVIIPNGITNIGEYAFYLCTNLTEVTLPPGLTSIREFTFQGCGSLTTVAIPNGVTNIGYMAFEGCSSLTGINIPESVIQIEPAAFSGCQAMTNVNIPGGLSAILDRTFYGCASLTRVFIPKNILNLGIASFEGCSGLNGVFFEGDAPEIDLSRDLFRGDDKAIVYYRSGTKGWASNFAGLPTALLDLFSIEFTPRPGELSNDDKTPVEAGRQALYFQSVPGKRYTVLGAASPGGPWEPETEVTATSTQKRVLVDKPANQRFYRVRIDL